jgi:FkbM family methyltransferase
MNRDLAAIQETFRAAAPPDNVRAAAKLGRKFFLRRFTHVALGSKLYSSAGTFEYRANGKTTTVNYDGRNLQFRALYDEAYRHGYEIETGLLMKKLCRGNGAFWDVGANWGYFSLLAAAFPDFSGPIAAFEPNPKTFSDLTSVVQQTGMAARITLLNQGVGATACEMTVAESDQFNSGLSRLEQNGAGKKIPVVTLDSVTAGKPNFIKVDAEGMELDILRGAEKTLRTAKPFVVFENFLESGDPAKTFAPIEFLRAQNYRIFIPALRFRVAGRAVAVSYGHDYNGLFAADPAPELCLHEPKDDERFLLAWQLNLLGVHTDRVAELWPAGIQKLTAEK